MRLTTILLRDIYKQIEQYAKFNPSPLSIKKFIDFGEFALKTVSLSLMKPCLPYCSSFDFSGRSASDKDSFLFLRKELPVRLANMMQEMQLLPENLLRMPSISLVQSWYERSFEEVLQFEKANADDESVLETFSEALTKIRNRHSNVVPTMAQGVLELKETHPVDQQTEHSIQYFLHRFYMSRISIRMLINQHVTLFGGGAAAPMGHVGCVDPNCNVSAVIHDAYENARFLCEQYYLAAPDLIVEQHNIQNPNTSVTITYVPSHLHHIVFELIKNSMRAVVEHHGADSDKLPPIRIIIVKGKEDLSLKISDLGGGIPRSLSEQLFHYMYSTAPKPPASGVESAPLAGYGYGLPLSRLYARYFQGDLVICSYEGYGTDAMVYLKVLTSEASELLPVFNKASLRRYKSNLANHDWSSAVSQEKANSSGNGTAAAIEGSSLHTF